MKKYFVNIDNTETPVEIELDELNNVKFGDITRKYEYHFITDNLLLLRINNKNYTVKIEDDEDAGEEIKNTNFTIDFKSTTHNVICKNELDVLVDKFSKTRGQKGFKKVLASPMPGAVVKINVKEGDRVNKGDVMLVLEAMKMENELKAEADAIVEKILVSEKKSVDKNETLIKLLPVENTQE
jgi:biotin carboxyl carrier protein